MGDARTRTGGTLGCLRVAGAVAAAAIGFSAPSLAQAPSPPPESGARGAFLPRERLKLVRPANQRRAAALADVDSGLPSRSAVPFLVTLELLLIERAVLLQLYERLSQRTPASIEALLELKQQIGNGLEEYYGATMAATRFSGQVAEEGERLFGIIDLYDALMDRLETVSFALTTRYQQRMMQMQFWLTVMFGAT